MSPCQKRGNEVDDLESLIERTTDEQHHGGQTQPTDLPQTANVPLTTVASALSEVDAMGRADKDPDEAIRVLDAELEATVDRLNRVRTELAVILRHRAPAHVPPAFAPVSRDLSDRQRSLLMVYSSVLSEESLEEFRAQISEGDETEEEFEALSPDADDAAVERLAVRMRPVVLRARETSPHLADMAAAAPRGTKRAERRRRPVYHPDPGSDESDKLALLASADLPARTREGEHSAAPVREADSAAFE
ncbi:hypothetical protein ACFQZ2_05955 [Streptomonospora algeriensis]|uniref:Uncharacterized protein n=1 Tax=Streptomonospora algeriensis TaxID=995084 RepID=A0ABW3BDS4_9ACTN